MSAEELTIQTPETPAASPSTPAAEPALTPAEPAAPEKPDPQDLRAVVQHAVNNPSNRGKHAQHQPRVDGKFAGPPKLPSASAQPPAVAATTVRPAMPKGFKAEMQTHWDKVPAEFFPLLESMTQRDTDFNKGMEMFKPAKAQLEDLLSVFKPYEQMMAAEGATPKAAIQNLLQTAAIFRTGSPAQKTQAVAAIMRQFNVSPEDLQSVLSGTAPTQPQALDPQSVNQLVTQAVQQQLTAHQQQQRAERAVSEIQAFAGNPANKHFEAVAEDMEMILSSPSFHQRHNGVPESEKLKLAYDLACRTNPEVFKAIQAEQQAQELAQRQAQAAAEVTQARQAAVQVKGAPTPSPATTTNPKDLRAVVKEAFARSR